MNIKVFTIFFGASLGLIIVSAVIGNILEAKGVLSTEMMGSNGRTGVVIFFFTLFSIMGFSVVPLFIRFFITMQVKIGNAEFVFIKWLQAHEQSAVYGFWLLIIVGLVLICTLVKPADMLDSRP